MLVPAVLGEGEGVELAAQPDGSPGAAAGQGPDDAGAANAGEHVEAERAQHVGDVGASRVLVERSLGDAVQLVSPLAQARVGCSCPSGDHQASLSGVVALVHHADALRTCQSS